MENQKQVFHPSHLPWKSRKTSGIPTFPQLRRLFLIKVRPEKSKPHQTSASKGGPKQTAEMGQMKLPNAARTGYRWKHRDLQRYQSHRRTSAGRRAWRDGQ